jgi:hypothetical protein
VPVTVDGSGDLRVTRVERATPMATASMQTLERADYTLVAETTDGQNTSATISTYVVRPAGTVTP